MSKHSQLVFQELIDHIQAGRADEAAASVHELLTSLWLDSKLVSRFVTEPR